MLACSHMHLQALVQRASRYARHYHFKYSDWSGPTDRMQQLSVLIFHHNLQKSTSIYSLPPFAPTCCSPTSLGPQIQRISCADHLRLILPCFIVAEISWHLTAKWHSVQKECASSLFYSAAAVSRLCPRHVGPRTLILFERPKFHWALG